MSAVHPEWADDRQAAFVFVWRSALAGPGDAYPPSGDTPPTLAQQPEGTVN
jgi:hypothetical protein